MTNEPDAPDDDATIMRRPAEPAPAAPAPTKILCSVGRNGINRPEDVLVVRALLNALMPAKLHPVMSERRCDPDLVAAIEDFQSRVVGMQTASGRVEPDGAVLHALIAG